MVDFVARVLFILLLSRCLVCPMLGPCSLTSCRVTCLERRTQPPQVGVGDPMGVGTEGIGALMVHLSPLCQPNSFCPKLLGVV